MKYRQLTKEQFESLHEEFSKFLATQGVDFNEWKKIKEQQPALAENELNLFSDIVWEDVLKRAEYLEHFSKNTINLFECKEDKISRIVIKVHKEVDLLTQNDYNWLLENYDSEDVELFNGTKNYSSERNIEIFDLIEKGSAISKGDLYNFFEKIIS
ncbi:DUF6495 family protein [Tenacibaculum jejuense]|uniref:Histidyl-tRNA synthetase n=1 Tax=Tenacibaculum jejuense TaxID=584609 RepID=A0A238UAG1_9FLAO|nr:DUF6495 family protein [Tenacibaculum jejuense]SNR16183.1 conserved protein of unknown function [Tenacibaculum jejuense]